MTGADSAPAQLRQRVLDLLVGVAPNIDAATLKPDREYREQFDFDSMDLFHFAAAVHESFGVDIPEKDYRQLAALDRCLAYLRERLPASPDGAA